MTGQGTTARAQLSHAVVVLKGTVRSEDNAKPTSVRVSVRVVGDTAREITSSTSNKETGKYLVILKPGKSYWVHLEGDSILTKDVLITTPESEHTQQIEQDFTVVMREATLERDASLRKDQMN
ncbi:MAG: hypothetical protein Q8922_13595 [Bacteroidota bacterium]|nr:hypothetical protein [Bacteroidota bacterium]MDP4233687.1 hypothetical protein [Bacteroidota bacterium]MDP4241856.1 hypothetical protein [Bacteroidota bacterium]MDP4288956.1 hypothetical protein [Bacteroidota bacterium]